MNLHATCFQREQSGECELSFGVKMGFGFQLRAYLDLYNIQ